MEKRVYLKGNYIVIQSDIDTEDDKYNLVNNVYAEINGSLFTFYRKANDKLIDSIRYEDIRDVDGNNYISLSYFTDLIINKTGKPNSVDTLSQDPSSPSFDLFFVSPLGSPTTLSVDSLIDDRTITVASTANFAVGTWIGIFNGLGRYYWGEVLEINGNILTLDSPLDFDFVVGNNVLPTTRDLSVDGSVEPKIFSIQAGASGLEIDVTRLIISMVCTDPIQLDLFGDQPKLTNGLLLRKVDGEYRNLMNNKTNYQIGVHSYDLTIYEKVKPNEPNALLSRSTWAGASKRGVVIRLKAGEELQLVVQDDLSAILNILILAQGHEVI